MCIHATFHSIAIHVEYWKSVCSATNRKKMGLNLNKPVNIRWYATANHLTSNNKYKTNNNNNKYQCQRTKLHECETVNIYVHNFRTWISLHTLAFICSIQFCQFSSGSSIHLSLTYSLTHSPVILICFENLKIPNAYTASKSSVIYSSNSYVCTRINTEWKQNNKGWMVAATAMVAAATKTSSNNIYLNSERG